MNADFHDEYFETRDMVGPDLVYITRYEHNTAKSFGICIVDTSQIVMHLSKSCHTLMLLFTIFTLLWL